jgi:hypothetical protein
MSQGLNSPSRVLSTDASRAELQSPPITHGFCQIDHEMWTAFVNNLQLRWLSCSGDIIPKGPSTVIGAFGPSLSISDFATSHSLRCNLTIPYFCFPLFECLSKGHSSDVFDNPINCRFTWWILGYLPQFP